MRTSLKNHAEVAHFWANQVQEEGRAGNMFFEGDVIYSYGKHFPIATFTTTPSGQKVILFNAASYSVSTGQHQGIVRRAIPANITVFTVPFDQYGASYRTVYLDGVSHKDVIVWFRHQCVKAYESAARARSAFEWKLGDAERLHNEFRLYVGAFELGEQARDALKIVGDLAERFSGVDLEELRKNLRERAAKAAAKKREAMKGKIEQWRAGDGSVRIYGLKPQLLRVVQARNFGKDLDQPYVQTSDGAEVTEQEARVAYKLLQRGKLTHGYKLGNYTVISVNGQLKIGCHVIDREEIDSLATARGWDK